MKYQENTKGDFNMEEKPHYDLRSRPIVCNGVQYDSVAAFCDAFNLRYRAVIGRLNAGSSPEKVLEVESNLPATASSKDDSKAAQACSYNGVDYPSISAATQALGITPNRVYLIRQKYKCSLNRALEIIMDELKEKDGFLGHTTPCVIDGVKYGSMAEACKAFGIPYISVMSTMRRTHCTFEEAIFTQSITQRYKSPVTMNFQLNMKPYKPDDEKDMLVTIADTLKRDTESAECFYDEDSDMGAVVVKSHLYGSKSNDQILLLIQHPKNGDLMNVVLLIPEVLRITNADAMTTEILLLLNSLNSRYAGITTFLYGESIRISSSTIQKRTAVNKRGFLLWYRQVLCAASEILRTLRELKVMPDLKSNYQTQKKGPAE